jgi:glutamine synthetase
MESGYTKMAHISREILITINQKDSEHGHFQMEIKLKEFTIKLREQILMMKI